MINDEVGVVHPNKPEFGGIDWSYQRRIATIAIHAMGCLGYVEMTDRPGEWCHKCRSVAGNVCAALYHSGQLVPDVFEKPKESQ
jgi:hypothetical protein